MELYTSLTRLKQSLNGGIAPAMTPLTDRARALFDPAFLIEGGMGGLQENERLGLRCPMRGCGQYHDYLGSHIAAAHTDVGVEVVKDALGLRRGVTLVSARVRSKPSKRRAAAIRASRAVVRKGRTGGRAQTTEELNARQSCMAQLQQAFRLCAEEMGRTPTRKEFWEKRHLDQINLVRRLFGSWRDFVASCGSQPLGAGAVPRWSRKLVVDSLMAWRDAHGRFPTTLEVTDADVLRWPKIPNYTTILRHMNCVSWYDVITILGGQPVYRRRRAA